MMLLAVIPISPYGHPLMQYTIHTVLIRVVLCVRRWNGGEVYGS